MSDNPVKTKADAQFPVLNQSDELELEMLVTDRDQLKAKNFLTEHRICVAKDDDPLEICKAWFRRIMNGKRGKLEIRFSGGRPTINLS